MNMWRKTIGGPHSPRGEEGQSLLETAFSVPLLMGIAFNLINLGYFWFMLIALSASSRQGVQFANQGGATGTGGSAPRTTSVSNMVCENMTSRITGATTSDPAVPV